LGSLPNFDFMTALIGPRQRSIGVRDKYVDDAERLETVAGKAGMRRELVGTLPLNGPIKPIKRLCALA
jgi:hypothetical protein